MWDGFKRAGAAPLFFAGAAMVLLAVAAESRETVATALVGSGAVLMSLAVLLPRLVGPLKFGAQGFEAELIEAVQKEAEAHGLSPEQTDKAIEVARTETDAWRAWLQEQMSKAATDLGQLADDARTDTGEPIVRLAKRYVERERKDRF